LTPAELAKILRDPKTQALFKNRWWRLSNLYKNLDKDGQEFIFKPKPSQEYVNKRLHNRNIILKSRQHGITTDMSLIGLDFSLWNPGVKVGIVAQTEDDAKEVFRTKIQYAYDNMDPMLQQMVPTKVKTKQMMEFANGSSIYVDCSLRGGTCQFLHVADYGATCADSPERANEVKPGALNTVSVNNYITIEGTAKGNSGIFHDFCEQARKLALAGKKLTPLDFKFFFIAWFCDPDNTMPDEFLDVVTITKEDEEYFAEKEVKVNQLSDAGIIMPLPGGAFSPNQKAWYVKKKVEQGDDMTSEHPTDPEEAFSASNEGCIYRVEMTAIHKNNRIMSVPYEINYPVITGWDIGGDGTSIWCAQIIHGEKRIINYYETLGITHPYAHYVKWLADQKYYVFGKHYLPHDAHQKKMLTHDVKTAKMMLEDLGVKGEIVERTASVEDSIQDVRGFLSNCVFDAKNCAVGIKHLEQYRRTQNRMGGWGGPAHDEHSHGADSIRTLACGLEMGKTSGKSSGFIKNRVKPSELAYR
jgi:hypothetical protein